jgi:putative transcriptional regulator
MAADYRGVHEVALAATRNALVLRKKSHSPGVGDPPGALLAYNEGQAPAPEHRALRAPRPDRELTLQEVDMRLRRYCMALVGSVVLAVSALSGAQAADVHEPALLVAKPELGEFYRSTVLFVRPMGNGRHVGFIINRPTPMTLGKLFPEHGPSQKVTNPVLLGGPMNVDSVFAVVHREAVPGDKSIPLSPEMSLAFDADTVDRIIENEGNAARFFVGLVVWQPGELEQELQKDFWFVMRNDADLVFRKTTDGLWEELVQRSRNSL